MWNENYDWHFDYARLAFDAGFSFKSRQIKISLDRESVSNVDVNKVIQERNVATIEKYIPTLIEYTLDNDQTSVLDPTFVKVFHLSQLAVEYLLFCKKYLDNTVVILKKGILKNTEEIADLKHELQQRDEEISTLKRKMKELKSAKLHYHAYPEDSPEPPQCTLCSKIFATQEFLDAHIKRRHEGQLPISTFQEETDKLQMEIKQLKERLNTTEKLVHSNESPSKEYECRESKIEDKTLVNELQQKFELLKVYVEGELKTLQTQSSEQHKYEKWFEVFLQRLESLMKSHTVTESNVSPIQVQPVRVETKMVKMDTTVQTDEPFVRDNKERNSCRNCKERERKKDADNNQTKMISKMMMDLKQLTETQLATLEYTLTEKVNASLDKLDRQMLSFNKKIDDIMAKSKKNAALVKSSQNIINITSTKNDLSTNVKEDKPKPVPKERKSIKHSSAPPLKNQEEILRTQSSEEGLSKPSSEDNDKVNSDLHIEGGLIEPQSQSDLKFSKGGPFSNSKETKIITQTTKAAVPKLKTPTTLFVVDRAKTAKERARLNKALSSNNVPDYEKSLKSSRAFTEPPEKIKEPMPLRTVLEEKSSTSVKFLFNKEYESETSSLDDESETASASSSLNDESKAVVVIKQEEAQVKPSTSTLGRRSITSLKAVALDNNVILGLKKELLHILENKLRGIGISPKLKGIPESVYRKTLLSILHQRKQNEKIYPGYKKAERDILKKLSFRIKEREKQVKNMIQISSKPAFGEGDVKKIFNKTEMVERRKEISDNVDKKPLQKFESINLENRKAETTQLQQESYSSSSSEESYVEDTKEDPTYIEQLTKSNKNLQKSYQSYSNVVQQIKERMQQKDMEKEDPIKVPSTINVLQNITNTSEATNSIKSENSMGSRNNSVKSNKSSSRSEKEYIEDANDSIRSGRGSNNNRNLTGNDNILIQSAESLDVNDVESIENDILVEEFDQKDDSVGKAPLVVQQQPKGVLKNYSNKAFNTKKKVLFDLESIESEAQGKADEGGGDSTSIASSVLDELDSPKKEKKVVVKEKDSDTSDFNFSEILT